MQLFRYLISTSRQASEYIWAPSFSIANEYAEHYFKNNNDILVKLTHKYDFAFTVGIANVRTYGDTLQDCLQNKQIYGFYGDHDIDKELKLEFVKQQTLAIIKTKEDLRKISKFNIKI